VTAEAPTCYSEKELKAFEKLVREGGEVISQGLTERIRGAAVLIMLRRLDKLVGIAALKRPEATYRTSIAEKCGADVNVDAYPYELGWMYVIPSEKGNKHSYRLMDAALRAGGDAGIFATTRTDILPCYKFFPAGVPYRSSRGKYHLALFLRLSSNERGAHTRLSH
jgi:hypothetical protein